MCLLEATKFSECHLHKSYDEIHHAFLLKLKSLVQLIWLSRILQSDNINKFLLQYPFSTSFAFMEYSLRVSILQINSRK